MMQNGLFYSLNDELKKQFGTKIIKLSLDGGFTCPNRDGNCGSRGCIFCSEVGSGEHAGSRALSIHEQMQEQIALLRSKWPQAKYIALIGHLLTLVPAHVVIHRLTGDGDKLKKISESGGIITTEGALELGIYKGVLRELVLSNKIVKIANGLYGLPGEEIDEYIYFAHRVPKGVFSHETAAYLHGLSTRMPIVYVMTVKTGDNVSRVREAKGNIVFKYSKEKNYELGKMKMENPFGREILVYDKEKTLLDIIKDKDRIDTYIFSEAIKLYFGSKDKDLLRLSKYAITMDMEELLRPYTEVLL